jgi:kinetochore protein Mis13/DSN1
MWSTAQPERKLISVQEDRPVPKHKLKPNPRNIANQAKIQELEQRLERYVLPTRLQEVTKRPRIRTERETWQRLLTRPEKPLIPPLAEAETEPAATSTDPSSLTSSDRSALALLTSSIASAESPDRTKADIPHRIYAIADNAEFAIDRLAASAHVLAQHLTHAEGVGRRVLKGCAARLEARERVAGASGRSRSREGDGDGEEGAEDVRTRDVLRALSRVVDR